MSTQTEFNKVSILGVEVDNISVNQAIDHLTKLAKQPDSRACYVVKPHIQQIEAATKDSKIKLLIDKAYLALPDGVSLNWAAYFDQKTKHRLIDVVTSGAKIVTKPQEMQLILPNHSWAASFTWSLLKDCAKQNLSVFLVGSPRNNVTIDDTRAFLEKRIPNLKIVGCLIGRDEKTGIFSDNLKDELIKQLEIAKPDIILVGLGFPRQEYLIAELAQKLKHGIFIGEGGTFDYESFGGRTKKAPLFIQAHGLEWLWRLVLEPYRLMRQLAIPRFVWRIYRRYQ